MNGHRIFPGTGYPMLFEESIRSILGNRASHVAEGAFDESWRKRWYRKGIRKILKKVQEIESTTPHKRALVLWSELAHDSLRQRSFHEPAFTNCLLGLVGALLGFIGLRGYSTVTPGYYQTNAQNFAETIHEYGSDVEYWYRLRSSDSTRKRIVGQLKDEGKTYFEISLIMNLSEYKVQKLVRELNAERSESAEH